MSRNLLFSPSPIIWSRLIQQGALFVIDREMMFFLLLFVLFLHSSFMNCVYRTESINCSDVIQVHVKGLLLLLLLLLLGLTLPIYIDDDRLSLFPPFNFVSNNLCKWMNIHDVQWWPQHVHMRCDRLDSWKDTNWGIQSLWSSFKKKEREISTFHLRSAFPK